MVFVSDKKLQIEQLAWKFDHLRTIIGQKVEPAKHRVKNLRQDFSLNMAFICHFDEKQLLPALGGDKK